MANDFERRIREAQRRVREKAVEGMGMVVDDLTRRSKELAPLDTGDLRGSGTGDVNVNTNSVIGTVSFNKPYAFIQHEDMSFNHPRGGQAKYLEQPLNQNRNRYKAFIRDRIREATE